MSNVLKDARVQQFLEIESQKQKFQQLVHTLNEQCWDICVDKTGQKLDSRTESCIANCVERFIDTTNFVVNRLESVQVTGPDEDELML
uniref:Mitochondrial import inner membrane translocase subunit n=1 Tax=Octopus bimaculoides TaxID=37653 RepID=A0A0L8G8J8_OCTBM